MSNFENSFNDLIHYHVVQFNRQMEDAVTFHKHMLKSLCAERISEGFNEAYRTHDQPVRIRIISPKRSKAIVDSVFQLGREIRRRMLPVRRNTTHRTNKQPDVIEGEFVVLSDEISNSNTDKEENQS